MSKAQTGLLAEIIGLYDKAPLLVSAISLTIVATPIVALLVRSSDKRYLARIHDRQHLREIGLKRDELRAGALEKAQANRQGRTEDAAARRSEK